MNKPWGNFPVRNGDPIYDVTLDKNRQIGAASLVVAQQLSEYKESLVNANDYEALEIIVEEFRHFVAGNTTASSTKFDSAYTYFQFNLQHKSPVKIQELVNIVARVITSINDNVEYVDELLSALEYLNLYKRENALLVLDQVFETEGEENLVEA